MRFLEFKPLTENIGTLEVPVPGPYRSKVVSAMQTALAALNYDVHDTSIVDERTMKAIADAQRNFGLPITGKPDSNFINALNRSMSSIPGLSDYIAKAMTSAKADADTVASAVAGASGVAGATPVPSTAGISTDKPAVRSATVGATPASSTAVAKGSAVIIGNEKRTGGSISWRTNNPGNVQYGPKARSFGAIGSAIASDGEPVAIMPTLDHGWKMQIALWRTPRYNNGTINQGCRTWAKAVHDYKGISPYTIALANAAGASVQTKVSDLSDEQLKNMVKKQAKLEGFKVGTVTTV